MNSMNYFKGKPNSVFQLRWPIFIITVVELQGKALVQEKMIGAVDFDKIHSHFAGTLSGMDKIQDDFLTVTLIEFTAGIIISAEI